VWLVPLPGDGLAAGEPQPIDGSDAGRASHEPRPVEVPKADGVRLSPPLLGGGNQVGVMVETADDLQDYDRRLLRRLASLVADTLVTGRRRDWPQWSSAPTGTPGASRHEGTVAADDIPFRASTGLPPQAAVARRLPARHTLQKRATVVTRRSPAPVDGRRAATSVVVAPAPARRSV
jgi:hypothetical protein